MPTEADSTFREFNRYTGDGKPGEPVGAPLPIGDPSSGVKHVKKREIREWANKFAIDAPIILGDVLAARDAAADSALEAALYAGPKADTIAIAKAVTTGMAPVGSYLRIVDIGAVWQRAPDNTPYVGGYPLQFGGGPKWFVLPDVNGNLHVSAFGAKGDGSDDRDPIYKCIDVQGAIGGGVVQFEAGKTYGIDRVFVSGRRGYLSLPDKVGLDLNGSTLQRLGTNYTDPFIENKNGGGAITTNHVLRNGTIKGTGAPGQLSDQGAGALFWRADGVLIENIKTEDTNGDGLSFRLAEGTVLRDVYIGDFGRNGLSPTSGTFVYDNFYVVGKPIAGANPGISIDAENDGETERAKHTFIYFETPDITFVDFHGTDGGTFGHEITMLAGRIGPRFKPLRFLATKKMTADHITIGPDVEIISGGGNAAAIEVQNISGGNIHRPFIKKSATATGIHRGVIVTGEVNDWDIDLRCDPVFDFGIEVSSGTLNSSHLAGDLDSVYLIGVDNVFGSCDINALTINGAGTTGNIFAAGALIKSIVEVSGGLKSAQRFGYLGLSAELAETTSALGARLKFRGRNLFSAQSLGLIEAFPDNLAQIGHGAAVEFYQPGSVDTGELRFYTSNGGSGRVERARINAAGHLQVFFLPIHANDAAAGVAGLAKNTFYTTSTGEVRIKL